MTINLYPDQQKFISDVYTQYNKGHSYVLGVAACGFGKSYCAASIVKDAYDRGRRVWFSVHLDVLVRQSYESFVDVLRPQGIMPDQIGIIQPGVKPHYDRPIQIVAQMAAYKRLHGKIMPKHYPGLLIEDECHTQAFRRASFETKLITNVPKTLGLTGTPCRTSPYETFQDVFTGLALSPTRPELVEMGRLVPFKFYAPNANLAASTSESDVKIAYDTPAAIKHSVKVYRDLGEGGKAIAFCVDVEHAQHVADEFNQQGIIAETINYKTKRGRPSDRYPESKSRSALIRAFDEGLIHVLTAKDVLAVGFDVKDTVVGLLLRPTDSRALHIQQIGRAGRCAPGKEYGIILDCAGNCEKHGYGNDVWTYDDIFVDPRERTEGGGAFDIPCVSCGQGISPLAKNCKHCGAAQPERQMETIHSVDFGSSLIEVVLPEALDPSKEADAKKYFRSLVRRAVMGGAKPGKGYLQLKADPDFGRWANKIPAGPSTWTLGAVFDDPTSINHAEDYFRFLARKYGDDRTLTSQAKERKIWYAINQEFLPSASAELRRRVEAGKVQSKPIKAHRTTKKARAPIMPAWVS